MFRTNLVTFTGLPSKWPFPVLTLLWIKSHSISISLLRAFHLSRNVPGLVVYLTKHKAPAFKDFWIHLREICQKVFQTIFKGKWHGPDWKSNRRSQDYLFSLSSNQRASSLSFSLFFLWYKRCLLKWLFFQCSIMLFMPFLTCFCLKVLIQVYHLLRLHFRNQKSSSHAKKTSEGGGLRVGLTSAKRR